MHLLTRALTFVDLSSNHSFSHQNFFLSTKWIPLCSELNVLEPTS